MNDLLIEQEKELCAKYDVENITQVLAKQKEILESKREGGLVKI